MGNKKKSLAVAAPLVVATLLLAVAFGAAGPLIAAGESGTDYSISFDKSTNKIGTEAWVSPSTVYSGSGYAMTGLGNKIAFDYNSFANPTSAWQIIKGGGYFTNTDPIHGMKSITFTKANSSTGLQIYWSSDTTFSETNSATYDTTSALTFTCDFSGYSPNYIKVVALGTGANAITSGSILFSCANQYPTLTLTADHTEMGSVSGGGIHKVGSNVTLAATPETGHSFAGWYNGSTLVSSENPYVFVMPESDLSYEARFTVNSYKVSLESKEIATTPAGSCELSGSGTYAYGSSATISAKPAAGYGFLGWYDGSTLISSKDSYTFTIPAKDVSYVAKYSKKYHVSVTSFDEAKGTVSGSGDFAYTANVTVTATGIGFYQAATWYDDSFSPVSTDLAYTFTMAEADIHLSADFQKALGSSFALGRYPQTVVEDSTLLTALASASDTDSDGYLEYGSGEYKKVTAAPYKSGYESASGTMTFVKGTTYYFKVEPIEWRVLSGKGKTIGLVMAEKILTNSAYYTSRNDRSVSGSTVHANNYQYSTLRAMLNGYDGSSYSVDNFTGKGFLDVAFTETEKAYITTTTVDNSAATTDSSTNSYACANTSDKIFALSYQDLLNTSYGFNSSTEYVDSRAGVLTDYARATGTDMFTGSPYYGAGCWLPRSPSASGSYIVSYVKLGGCLGGSWVEYAASSVRPSFTLNIG